MAMSFFGLSTLMTLIDFEFKNRTFSDFLAIFLLRKKCIATKWMEIDQD